MASEPLELLIKLLGQTTNDNDNVALMAVRKANAQLEKLGVGTTWEKLLHGKVTVMADPFADAPLNRPTAAQDGSFVNVTPRHASGFSVPPRPSAAPPPPPPQTRTCRKCGRLFTVQPAGLSFYCSSACLNKPSSGAKRRYRGGPGKRSAADLLNDVF